MAGGLSEVHVTQSKLDRVNKAAKQFIDANVHDGDDRSGCDSDRVVMDPDELQELAEDLLEYLLKTKEIR